MQAIRIINRVNILLRQNASQYITPPGKGNRDPAQTKYQYNNQKHLEQLQITDIQIIPSSHLIINTYQIRNFPLYFMKLIITLVIYCVNYSIIFSAVLLPPGHPPHPSCRRPPGSHGWAHHLSTLFPRNTSEVPFHILPLEHSVGPVHRYGHK